MTPAHTQSLIRVMQETAGAPDLESFRHMLFSILDEELKLPMMALSYRSGVGTVRIAQSHSVSEFELHTKFPDVVAEQASFLDLPYEQQVVVIGEAVPDGIQDSLHTVHSMWKPNGIIDGVTATLDGSSGMRAQMVLLVEHRKRLRSLRPFLEGLAPYLERTLDHLAFLERQRVQIDCLEEVVRMTAPAIVIDSRGEVHWISQAARSLFARLMVRTEMPNALRDWIARRCATDEPLVAPNQEHCLLVHGTWLHIRSKVVHSALDTFELITIDDPVSRQAEAFQSRCIELGLTRRQREIAQKIVEGKLNKEIASQLGISLNTVKNHVKAMYALADVRNRAAFIRTMLDQ